MIGCLSMPVKTTPLHCLCGAEVLTSAILAGLLKGQSPVLNCVSGCKSALQQEAKGNAPVGAPAIFEANDGCKEFSLSGYLFAVGERDH
jgi:hypothetical protein